ncbi:magnesium transporter [Candidatus Bathyarchaeota archaeon]|nr:MAG: magnesium transporter [Candidatus Bathyarchaeota archaeon]
MSHGVGASISFGDRIVKLLKEKRDIKPLLEWIKPQDFIPILERLPKDDRLSLVLSLNDDVIEKFLPKLPAEIVEEVMFGMDRNRFIRIVSNLPADELSDLVEKLSPINRKRLLWELPDWKLNEIKPLLSYPPDKVGGLMTNRIPVFFEEAEIWKVIREYVTRTKFDEYDTNNYAYAIDKNGKLKGLISIRELLTSPRKLKLKDVVQPPPVTIKPDADEEEAARIVASYDLLELPVVDDDGKLLGAVTVDDVVDVVISESTEDMVKFGGVEKITTPYIMASIFELTKKRVAWLIFLCLIEVIVAGVLSFYGKIISTIVALSFFIPLISSTGGNSGIQASIFIIRGLAVGEVSISDALRVLVKESLTSLFLSLLLSPLTFFLGFLIAKNIWVALTLSISLILIIFTVNIVGSLLPMLAAKVGIDPATISAPLIATIADLVGLLIYFTVATILLF